MTLAQDPLRVACLGAGYFSQFHYESWARMARAQLVAACNRDIGKLAEKGVPAYSDLGEMLRRHQPDSLDDGLIGSVQQLTFRLRPGDGQGPRAYLDRQPYFQRMERFLVHETAVHWVDTFRYLLGEPLSVYADLRRLNPAIAGEDAGYILFEHENGARALFDGNRHLDHAADNLRCTMGEALVEGDEGTLGLCGDGSVFHRAFGSTSTAMLLPASTWQGFGGDCVHALQSHVVKALLDGTALENTAQDYLSVMRIDRSAREGRKLKLECM